MTERQLKVLKFIKAYVRKNKGISPSYAELCAGTGLSSRSQVSEALGCLEEAGHISRVAKSARGIILTPSVCRNCGKEIA